MNRPRRSEPENLYSVSKDARDMFVRRIFLSDVGLSIFVVNFCSSFELLRMDLNFNDASDDDIVDDLSSWYFKNLVVEYVVNIADEIIQALPIHILLLATEVAHVENGDDDAATDADATTVGNVDDEEFIFVAREENDVFAAKDIFIWLLEEDEIKENAIMYAERWF